MTQEQQILWLAGLLEGEACFRWQRRHGDGACTEVAVDLRMTDEDVIRKAAKIMNSTVRQHAPAKIGTKIVFHACISGGRAISVMRQVLPFMGVRRSAKIEEIICKWNTRLTRSESSRINHAKRRKCKNTGNLFIAARLA